MSDFDKEAEREKLRKKYERDEEKREATQRMSELLLQGATMTNTHCDDCGDPIFRYDGREFCPTCQAASDRAGDVQADAAGGEVSEATPEQPAAAHRTGSAQAGAVQADSEQAGTQRTGAEQTGAEQTGAEQTDAVETDPNSAGVSSADQPDGSRTAPTPTPPSTAADRTDETEIPAAVQTQAGDLTAARESLVRTVQRYAEQAERADDPRRAREALTAAREAAETLAVLDR